MPKNNPIGPWSEPHPTAGVTHLLIQKKRAYNVHRQYTATPHDTTGAASAVVIGQNFSTIDEAYFAPSDGIPIELAKAWLEERAQEFGDHKHYESN